MIKLGIYRHSKSGNLYRVIRVVKHSETLEDMIEYEALYDNTVSKFWVRPIMMFEDIIEINNNKVPRFVFVREE